MSRGPGLLCSGIGSTSIAESTCCSFWKSVEEGNWKRYKIGDSVVVARRFRFDYLYIFIVFLEHLFFPIDVSSLRWLSCLCFSNTLFSDALLIPPLHTNSALMGLQFIFFSHH